MTVPETSLTVLYDQAFPKITGEGLIYTVCHTHPDTVPDEADDDFDIVKKLTGLVPPLLGDIQAYHQIQSTSCPNDPNRNYLVMRHVHEDFDRLMTIYNYIQSGEICCDAEQEKDLKQFYKNALSLVRACIQRLKTVSPELAAMVITALGEGDQSA